MCPISLLLWPGFSCKFRALVTLCLPDCLPSVTRKMRNTLFPSCLLIAVSYVIVTSNRLYVRCAYHYVLAQTVEVEYFKLIYKAKSGWILSSRNCIVT